jgi:hypothetical protein
MSWKTLAGCCWFSPWMIKGKRVTVTVQDFILCNGCHPISWSFFQFFF